MVLNILLFGFNWCSRLGERKLIGSGNVGISGDGCCLENGRGLS